MKVPKPHYDEDNYDFHGSVAQIHINISINPDHSP